MASGSAPAGFVADDDQETAEGLGIPSPNIRSDLRRLVYLYLAPGRDGLARDVRLAAFRENDRA